MIQSKKTFIYILGVGLIVILSCLLASKWLVKSSLSNQTKISQNTLTALDQAGNLQPNKTTFSASEPVRFVVNFPSKQKVSLQFPSLIKAVFAQEEASPQATVTAGDQVAEAKVYYARDNINQDPPTILPADVAVEITPQQGNYILSILKKINHQFRPGRYTLQITLIQNGQVNNLTQDFTWGVLAINTNKSIFQPGETAHIQIAVLDNLGKMVCDAQVNLKVKNQNSKIEEELSTENGKIKVNETDCHIYAVTQHPDYEATYQVKEAGTYKMELTATTPNGTFTISDSFLVDQNKPFVVERIDHTRIWPAAIYPVELKITANQDFAGVVEDLLPVNFVVIPNENFHITQNGNTQTLKWQIALQQGESTILAYQYDPPDESPEFYLLGPLQLVDTHSGQALFIEARQWQLAIDDTHVWTGTTDANWSVGTNWSPNTPANSDTLSFDNTCTSCDSTIDSSFALTGVVVSIASTHTGTITDSKTSLTVGSFTQNGGTFNLGSNTLAVTNAFTQGGGVFSGASGNLDLNGAFSLTTPGSFTAPGTGKSFTTVGNFAINSGTFTHSSGTVTLDGLLASAVTCGATDFNLVAVSKGAATIDVTVGSGCTLPLGDAASSTGDIYVNSGGTLTVGTGTWAHAGYLTLNSGGTITSTATTWTISYSLTLNSGGNLTPTNLANVNVGANFDNSGSLLPATGITLTFDTAANMSADTVCGTITFTQVYISKASVTNTVRVGSGCTFPLGNTASSTGAITVQSGGTLTVGTGTWTLNGSLTLNSGGTITSTATTWTISYSLTLNSGGNLTPTNLANVNVGQNFDNSGSLLPATGITLTFDTSANMNADTVCGTITFTQVNISKGGGTNTVRVGSGCTFPLGNTASSTGAITVQSGGTLTVGTGTWTLNGSLTLNSGGTITSTATTWTSSSGSLTLNSGGNLTPTNLTTLNVAVSLDNSGNLLPNNLALTLSTSVDGTLTCGNASFASITINKGPSSGFVITPGGNCTIGDFTFTSGALANPASAYTYYLTGNFLDNSTSTYPIGGANLTFNFNGTSNQTITQGKSTFSSPFTDNNSSAVLSLSSAFTTTTEACTVAAGIFDLNGQTFTCGGTFTIQSGATLRMIGTETTTLPTLNSGSTVSYKGDGDSAADTFYPDQWTFTNVSFSPTDSGDVFAANSTNDLATSLSAYYIMEEGSGSTVVDTSGNLAAAEITNATFSSTVPTLQYSNSYSINFDGSGDYLNPGANLSLAQNIGALSITAWIRPATVSGTHQIFGLSTNGSSATSRVDFSQSATNLVCTVRADDSTAVSITTTTAPLAINTWYHVACVVDIANDTINIYVNRALQAPSGTASFTPTTTPNSTSQTSSIGIDEDKVGNDFSGQIDEVRFYPLALTPSEIKMLSQGYNTTAISALTVTGNLTIGSGTFSAPATTTIGGNFTNNGTFTNNSGTVVFNDASQVSNITGSGNITFNNLTAATNAKIIKFQAGKTFQTNGLLTVTGTANNQVNLVSDTPGTQWIINHQGTESVSYAFIQDGGCDGASSNISIYMSRSGGNNGPCWGDTGAIFPTQVYTTIKGNVTIKGTTNIGAN